MSRTGSQTVTDPALLEAALEGLLLQRQRLEEQISHVRTMLGGRRTASRRSSAGVALPARKRQLSDAARRRIAAAQKKRWAEYRKAAATEK